MPSADATFATAMVRLEQDKPAEAIRLLEPLAKGKKARARFALAVLLDLGVGGAFDRERTEALLASASKDFPAAAHYLAWKHRVGFVAHEDAAEAERWQTEAARLPLGELPLPSGWLRVRGGEFLPGFSRAYLWLTDAAEAGDAIAMSNLAEVYLSNRWVAPDPALHLHWLTRAAEAGSAPAAERLSMYYRMGLFVQTDGERADDYLRRAAEAGAVEAQHSLAEKLVDRDPASAVAWYQRAIDQGHTGAMIDLGRLYRDGEVVGQDEAAAVELFRTAVAQGSQVAMGDLGWMYEQGRGVPKDLDAALQLYQQAAEQGNEWAANALGNLYALESFPGHDMAKAIEAYKNAAELESVAAMFSLGDIFYYGTGVTKDEAEAFLWYERAAREGDAGAQNRLGWMLRNGYGIEKDDEEAVHWFRLAAEKEFAWGHANLGFHFAEGRGVDRDALKAFQHMGEALQTLDDDWLAKNFWKLFLNAPATDHSALRTALEAVAKDDAITPDSPLFVRITLLLLDGPEFVRDQARGAERLKLASRGERGWALSELAHRSYYGDGLPLDAAAAAEYAVRAAATGYSAGKRLLALIDLHGGTPRARREAVETLTALADRGDGRAAWELATTYASGLGMPEDLEQAWHFVEQAQKNGLSVDRSYATESEEDRLLILRRYFGASSFESDLSRLYVTAEKEAAKRPDNAPPEVLQKVAPSYPRALFRTGIDGEAVAMLTVSEYGRPAEIRIESASHPLFAAAAEASLRKWWFIPGKRNGVPTTSQVRQSLFFKAPQFREVNSNPANP